MLAEVRVKVFLKKGKPGKHVVYLLKIGGRKTGLPSQRALYALSVQLERFKSGAN